MAGRRPWRRLLPLVLATAATQASIVVLAPLVVEIGRDLGGSVSAVGLARSVLAGTAVAVSLAIGPLIDRIGVRPLIVRGAAIAVAGAGLTAAAPSLALFYAAHAVTGAGVACLLSAGFAGVAASFADDEAAWAMGWVVGAQSLAWIVGNPIIGLLAEAGSWRLSYAVPGAIALVALAAGLAAPRAAGTVAAEGEGASIRDGLAAVFRDPVGAALDRRRAGGLLRVDRRAHLRRRVLHRDLRRGRGHHRLAAGGGLGGVPDHVAEHRAPHRPLPHPAADRDRAPSGWRPRWPRSST